MENFQLLLFVLGAVAIIAVLVHGFWSIRKQQPKSAKDSPMADFYKDQAAKKQADVSGSEYVSEPRVIKEEPRMPPKKPTSTHIQRQEPSIHIEPEVNSVNAPVTKVEPSIAPQVEPIAAEVKAAIAEPEVTPQETIAPVAAEVVAEPIHAAEELTPEPVVETAPVAKEPEPLGDPVDVLVLHVVAKEGKVLGGDELLPCLLTLNLKFGDMQIFHRHEDNAGTGPVLFSLANMVKPGVFDPDNMEQFTTNGVVLFLQLPCHGDAKRNFSIMLNSAYQLADDLDAIVLDGKRELWTEVSKQAYLSRIKAAAAV